MHQEFTNFWTSQTIINNYFEISKKGTYLSILKNFFTDIFINLLSLLLIIGESAMSYVDITILEAIFDLCGM